MLTSDSSIEVAGEAADGREALRHAHDLSPDVVLMDVRMPDVDGIAAHTRPGCFGPYTLQDRGLHP